MTKTFKITLTPTGRFFFGGETKFGDPSLDDRRTTYVIKSQFFPQQTALLGMLREQLLLQNGLLSNTRGRISNPAAATQLIGPTGFQASSQLNNFGVISSISEVFIADGSGHLWHPAPLDDCLMPRKNQKKRTLKMKFRLHGTALTPAPVLENLDPKKGTMLQFQKLRSDAGDPIVNTCIDKLFSRETQIGITKSTKTWRRTNETDRNDDEGYYKQTFLRFNPAAPQVPTAFVFFVTLNDSYPSPVQLNSVIVNMGGERSTFKMEVSESALPPLNLKYQHTLNDSPDRQLVLTSDAFVDINALRIASHFIVANAVSFRFLSSTIGHTDHFHSLGQSTDKKLVSSSQYHLLQRGGVVYFPEENRSAIEKLFLHPDFQQIGYNSYQIL